MEAAMSSVSFPHPFVPTDPALEALELRDVGARDLTPTLGSAITWTDVDRMWAREQERRDAAATIPAGYRDAACEACGAALFVPVGQAGDVLCARCQCDGEALAAQEDSDPRPPTAGALRATSEYWQDVAAPWDDEQLIDAINLADAEPHRVNLDGVQRAACLDGFTRELLRRMDRAPRLAA
jgi:uncharacterized Zn finger protein (UPF0148 family)